MWKNTRKTRDLEERVWALENPSLPIGSKWFLRFMNSPTTISPEKLEVIIIKSEVERELYGYKRRYSVFDLTNNTLYEYVSEQRLEEYEG